MKANQKGFSLVEVMIAIVVISAIGAVGWLVYDRQSNKPAAQQAPQQEKAAVASTEGQKAIIIPSDWQWFTSKDSSTKFAYPKAWGTMVEKTESSQATYDTGTFIGRVTVSSKSDFLTQLPRGYVDYVWYKWENRSDALVSAEDTNPPNDYNTSYVKPITLGTLQAIEPLYEASRGKAIYEVIGKGAMNCGVHHYFFSVKDKVVHIPATLCTSDGEWEPQPGQAYREVVTDPIKNFYKYIES